MLGPTSALLLLAVAAPPAIEWRAPPGCPTRDDVLAALAALTRPPDLEGVRVRGVIRRVGKRYALHLDIHTSRLNQRRVERADACDALDGAAALIIAVAVDPGELLPAPSPAPTETEQEPAVPVPPDVPPPPELDPAPAPPELDPAPAEPAPLDPTPLDPTPHDPAPLDPPQALEPPQAARAPAPVRPARWTDAFLRLEAALDVGATPTVAGDIGGAVGLLRPRLRLELLGLYLTPRPLHHVGERVGTLSRWAVGARACGRIVRRALEVPLCGGLEAGQLLAEGAGITVRIQRARPPWFAILLGLGLVWTPHPRIGLGLRAELVVSPWRAPFTVSDDLVFTTRPVGARVGGGLEIRLGPGARGDGSPRPRPRSR